MMGLPERKLSEFLHGLLIACYNGVSANLLYGFERFNLQNLEKAVPIMATTFSVFVTFGEMGQSWMRYDG
jgi:hypothetical protein